MWMLSPESGVNEYVPYLPLHYLQVTKLLMEWEGLLSSFLAHQRLKQTNKQKLELGYGEAETGMEQSALSVHGHLESMWAAESK